MGRPADRPDEGQNPALSGPWKARFIADSVSLRVLRGGDPNND